MWTSMRKTIHRIWNAPTGVLLFVFTLFDLLAGLMHWFLSQGILHSRFFRLPRDRGLAESLQYLKLGAVIYMLVAWRRTRPSKLITAWIILFAIMLFDDAIGVHEFVAKLLLPLVPDFSTPGGMRIKDLLEEGSIAVIEGAACLYVAFRYLQAPPDLRAYSKRLCVALIPLVVFGLLFDLPYLPLTEQIGEMAGMSVLLGFVHIHYRRRTAWGEA